MRCRAMPPIILEISAFSPVGSDILKRYEHIVHTILKKGMLIRGNGKSLVLTWTQYNLLIAPCRCYFIYTDRVRRGYMWIIFYKCT